MSDEGDKFRGKIAEAKGMSVVPRKVRKEGSR